MKLFSKTSKEAAVMATEVFPGITDWENYDNRCDQAVAIMREKIKQAAVERALVLRHLPAWKLHNRERLKTAVEERYVLKVKIAEEECDRACQVAMDELMTALDARPGHTVD